MGRIYRPTSRETLVRILYSRYRYNAKQDRRAFTIKLATFQRIIEADCAYCGSPPSNVVTRRGSKLKYTGIDRVNNRKGYVPGNVFPCCMTCNRAKGRMRLSEFLRWLSAVVEKYRSRWE